MFQTKSLLKANGLILAEELTKAQEFSSLIFGLTPGWWLFEDENLRIKGSPLLSRKMWKRVLQEHGFTRINALGLPIDLDDLEQSVIVGENDGRPLNRPEYVVKAIFDVKAIQGGMVAHQCKRSPETLNGERRLSDGYSFTSITSISANKREALGRYFFNHNGGWRA